MYQPKWVTCPEKSAGIDVQVPDTECMQCGQCAEALQAWLRRLPKVNLSDETASDMLYRKERKKGYCPRVKIKAVECNAASKLCPYAWLCSDPHPRRKFVLMLKEELMFLVKDNGGNIHKSDATSMNKVVIDNTVKAVYESRQQLVGAWSLVPVTKENENKVVKLPKNLAAASKFILCDKMSKKFNAEVQGNVKAAVEKITTDPTVRALLIAKEYKPVFEVKLTPINAPKRRRTKS